MKKAAATALALWLGVTGTVAADDIADATAVVMRLQAQLVETAGLDPDPGLADREARLDPVIRETHDLGTMGRLTVRRSWREWSEMQKATFSDAFAALSIATYASRFGGVHSDSFEIVGGSASGERRVEVNSRIRRNDGSAVTLDYLVENDGDGWRIINVLADGASELSLMAAEYFDILEQAGFDGLIAALEEKRAALSERPAQDR